MLLGVSCLLTVLGMTANGQKKESQTSIQQSDDVIRIQSDLIQAAVTVFDKDGRFVTGLSREQFELKVDGVSQPISFFEQVVAGSANEEAQIAASRGTISNSPAETQNPGIERGRSVIFFIDDLHLSLSSLGRTRKMLETFIEKEMGQNDQVAIASTSGQIGFLQQFTDNKAVLRAAVARLVHRPYIVNDLANDRTPMTEYMALAIERKEDPGVLQFYTDECCKWAPMRYPRSTCEVEVINRARMILLQAASVISNTYYSLETLMRTSAQLPGRKLAFFISDGFLLDTGPRNSGPRDRLADITDAALRAGVVIYSIDARGLVSGALDATDNVPFDPSSRLESTLLREIPASQDALNALAVDTGGKALRNQNFFGPWINKVLEETSNYYLLAWRPDTEGETNRKFKSIKVQVIGRPDLKVSLPRGFMNAKPAPTVTRKPGSPPETKTPPEQIREALNAPHPTRDVPTSLSVVYIDTPANGAVITVSVQVRNGSLSYATENGKESAAVDLAGVVVNDKGKRVDGFQTRLNVDAIPSDKTSPARSNTIYNHRIPLSPGIYQVRVAVRDGKNGQLGGATQWIEIPDLTSRQLTLSSLIVGLQNVQAKGEGDETKADRQVQFSVDHSFSRHAPLSFVAFIYNGNRGEGLNSNSEIIGEAQLLRNGQTVLKLPPRVIETVKQDRARISFGSVIKPDSLTPGRYILEVTVTDRITNTRASQRTAVTIW